MQRTHRRCQPAALMLDVEVSHRDTIHCETEALAVPQVRRVVDAEVCETLIALQAEQCARACLVSDARNVFDFARTGPCDQIETYLVPIERPVPHPAAVFPVWQ